MDIIIVGCGRVGRNIAEELSTEEHSITVIDTQQTALDKIDDTQNILTIEGNGATYKVLEEANIKSADLLIAVTSTDELNLYTCLIAKKAGAKNTIARVRNPEYTKDIGMIQDDLKLSMTINPELVAAQEISRLIKYPGAIKIDSFGHGVADLVRLKVIENSPIANKKVEDCSKIIRDYVRICLVERAGEIYIPDGSFEILPNDTVSFITPAKFAEKLLKLTGYREVKGNHVIILGGGRISFYLASELQAAGFSVKIIEKDTQRCEDLSEELNNILIINGDATDEDLLLSEGIESADAVVSMLSTDEENVLVSLYTKQINKKANVITELGNISLTSIVENLPLDKTIMPKQLSGEQIVKYVRGMSNAGESNVETMYRVANGKIEALEFKVTREGAVTGKPLSTLSLKDNLHIICIIRNHRIIIPTGENTIEKDDTVFVLTKIKGLTNLDDILR